MRQVASSSTRRTLGWLATDSPAKLEGHTQPLQNLKGFVEDAPHLVIRIKACISTFIDKKYQN